MPVATLSTLALSVTVSFGRTQLRTHRAEVQEAGEGNDPGVHGVENVTTIELGGQELSIWVNEHRIKQRTDQKTIS